MAGPDGQANPPPSGVAFPVRGGVRQPRQLRSRRDGTNFGGIIATLSAPPNVTTTSLRSAPSACRTGITAAGGGLAPYAWAVSGGTLPPGLRLARERAPERHATISGQYTVTFSVTDSNFLSNRANWSSPSNPSAPLDTGRSPATEASSATAAPSSTGPPGACISTHHRRHGRDTDDAGTGCSLRRRHLRLRRRRLLRVDRRHASQCADRRHDAHPRRRRLLARRLGRRDLLLRDATFYGSTGGLTLDKPIVGMARPSTGTATGSWHPTAGSSLSATPASSARPAASRCRSRSSG